METVFDNKYFTFSTSKGAFLRFVEKACQRKKERRNVIKVSDYTLLTS